MKSYRKRIADKLLAEKLQEKGAVLIQGPKWCGKTTTAEQTARSVLYLDDSERKTQNLLAAESQPKRLLAGAIPRLIDEWQLAPSLWDAIRFDVDHDATLGKFILTGSAVPADKSKISHSGTGRFSWLTMRPMSLWESGESSGTVSLAALFAGEDACGNAKCPSLEETAFLTARGGWPRAVGMTGRPALAQARDYVDAVAEIDIARVDGIRRNPAFVRRLLRSLARLQGTRSAIGAIQADIAANEASPPHANTLYDHIAALKAIFVVEDMPAWEPRLRGKTAIRTGDTRYYTDPSIAVAALGLGPGDLLDDLPAFGFFFEGLAVRDLRTYAEALDGSVSHYHDKSGLECDAVVALRNGTFGLVEIKLGGERLVEEGCASLLRVERGLDTTRMKAPAFKMVLTACGDFAYRRPDGIFVCPVSCLKD